MSTHLNARIYAWLHERGAMHVASTFSSPRTCDSAASYALSSLLFFVGAGGAFLREKKLPMLPQIDSIPCKTVWRGELAKFDKSLNVSVSMY